MRTRVEAFIVEQYAAGRSLNELAELTGSVDRAGAKAVLNRGAMGGTLPSCLT